MIKLLGGLSRVKITGLNVNKVLACAEQNGIKLKNVRRSEYTEIEFSVKSGDVPSLRALLNEDEYRFSFVSASKRERFFERNKTRFVLFFGLIAATAALCILSNRTWTVRVYGLNDSSAAVSAAEDAGALSWHGQIDTDAVSRAVKNTDGEIIWVSSSVRGAAVEIFVKTKQHKRENDFCEKIVAAKDGVIRNLIVTGGTANAENGQTVTKGQTLITGKAQIGETEIPQSAEGKAMASVFYYESVAVPASEETEVPTGRETERTAFSFFGLEIKSGKAVPYESFKEEKQEVKTFFLPIKIYKIIYRETETVTVTHEKEALIAQNQKELEKKIYSSLAKDAAVRDKSAGAEENDGIFTVWVYVETVEDVAQRG